MNRQVAVPAVALSLTALLLASPSAATGSRHHTHATSAVAAPVAASVETPSLYDDEAGGNANGDDPAIWVDRAHSRHSLVVGTKKEGGLDVYNLDGQIVQSIAAPVPPGAGPEDEPGRFNNVDIVQGARVGGSRVDLAIVSDRGADLIRTYVINGHAAQPLTEVTSPSAPYAFATTREQVRDQETAYGLAAWLDPETGRVYAAVSQRHTSAVRIFRLVSTSSGVSYQAVRTVTLPVSFPLPNGTTWVPCEDPGDGPQVEGMVIDRDTQVVYAAQEDVGIWSFPLLDGGRPALVDKVREYGVPYTYDPVEEECLHDFSQDPGYGGRHIAADAEGLSIYYDGDDEGYLLASSQGDNTFVAYDREGRHQFLGSFEVWFGDDQVESSDGSTVSNVSLGRFDRGLFIAHDGHDTPEEVDSEGETREKTNFKFVAWERVARPLDLSINTGS